MSGKIRAGETDLVIKDLSDKEKFQNQIFRLESMLFVSQGVLEVGSQTQSQDKRCECLDNTGGGDWLRTRIETHLCLASKPRSSPHTLIGSKVRVCALLVAWYSNSEPAFLSWPVCVQVQPPCFPHCVHPRNYLPLIASVSYVVK